MIKYLYKNVRSKKLTYPTEYKDGAWVWVENPSDEEADKLISEFKLDRGLISDALDEDEMPRMERNGDLTYIFTRYSYSGNDLQVSTAPLLFILNEKLLITISKAQIPVLNNFLDGTIDFNSTQRTKLVLQILDQIVNQYENYLNTISRQIKSIRARLRVEKIRNQDFIDFVLIEDELNEFLSALTPTNAILKRMLLGKHIKLYSEDQDLVQDLMLNNEQSIEACKSNLKTIVNIRESYSTIMSNNLNRVIRLLTVLTVVLAVPTLISSIYGMNIALPFDHEPYAFGMIMLFSLGLSVVLLTLFKKNDWL